MFRSLRWLGLLGPAVAANLDREKLNQVVGSIFVGGFLSESMAWLRAFVNLNFVTRIERYASCAPRCPCQAASQEPKNIDIHNAKCKKSVRVEHCAPSLEIKILLHFSRGNAILDF